MGDDCCHTTASHDDRQFPNPPPSSDTLRNVTALNGDYPSMSNSTNVVTSDSQSSAADIVQIPLFTLIIIFAGVYAVFVFSRRTPRASKFTWLTVNVCVASACFAMIQLVTISIRLRNISETSVSCRSKGFIINMATCHVMYSHCAASICRLLSIYYPQKPLFKSTRWLLGSLAASWVVGVLIALPNLFLDSFTCSSSYGKSFLRIYTPLSTILTPIIIVALCNIIIFRYVRQSSKRIHSFSENRTTNNVLSRRDVNLCKTMLLTFCVFIAGWGPLFIEETFFNYQYSFKTSISTVFQILSPTSLLADVILLIYSDHLVRSVLLKLLKCNGNAP